MADLANHLTLGKEMDDNMADVNLFAAQLFPALIWLTISVTLIPICLTVLVFLGKFKKEK